MLEVVGVLAAVVDGAVLPVPLLGCACLPSSSVMSKSSASDAGLSAGSVGEGVGVHPVRGTARLPGVSVTGLGLLGECG